MKLTAKDTIGLALVVGTLGVLFAHVGPDGHESQHPTPVADAGGAVTIATPTTTVAFVDVNVVPMAGSPLLHRQVVVVEGGFVRRVGPVGVVEPPVGARIIDGEGRRYLAPGLTDAHVHLPDDAETWLPMFVANGVTTVFNLKGDPSHIELRDRLRAGELIGPTLYTSGPFTNEPGVRTPEQGANAVREQSRRGYDFVKIHGTVSAETLRAMIEVGRSEGIAVIGHAPKNLSLDEAVAAGQMGIVHAEELIYTRFDNLDPRGIDEVAIAMAQAGTWLTPTLSTFEAISRQWGETAQLERGLESELSRYLPESIRRAWLHDNPYTVRDPAGRGRIESMLEFQYPLVRELHRAGVPMLTGTDTPLPLLWPGFSLHDEVEALTKAGFSRLEAMEAATKNAGLFVRRYVDSSASFGTVTPGARADLLLLDANPLEDLGRLRRPAGVMVRGDWYDRARLERMLSSAVGPPGG